MCLSFSSCTGAASRQLKDLQGNGQARTQGLHPAQQGASPHCGEGRPPGVSLPLPICATAPPARCGSWAEIGCSGMLPAPPPKTEGGGVGDVELSARPPPPKDFRLPEQTLEFPPTPHLGSSPSLGGAGLPRAPRCSGQRPGSARDDALFLSSHASNPSAKLVGRDSKTQLRSLLLIPSPHLGGVRAPPAPSRMLLGLPWPPPRRPLPIAAKPLSQRKQPNSSATLSPPSLSSSSPSSLPPSTPESPPLVSPSRGSWAGPQISPKFAPSLLSSVTAAGGRPRMLSFSGPVLCLLLSFGTGLGWLRVV